MAIVNKATLKGFFEQGDIPTQGQYFNLIDSTFNLADTDAQVLQGTISASVGDFEHLKLKKAFIPGIGVGTAKVGTSFVVGNTLEIVGDLNLTNGNVSASGIGPYGTGSFMNLNVADYGTITASGNISSSATVIASNVKVYGSTGVRVFGPDNRNITLRPGSDGGLDDETPSLQTAAKNLAITLDTSGAYADNITRFTVRKHGGGFSTAATTIFEMDGTGNITGSGAISSSGAISTDGNLSSSAQVTCEHLFSSDDAEITDALTVGGNINANGNIVGDGSTAISSMASLGIGSVTATGTIQAEQLTSTDDITATGTVTAEQLTSTDDITATGGITAGGSIKTTGGNLLGNNMGAIPLSHIPMVPSDFGVGDLGGKDGVMAGTSIKTSDSSINLYASYMIPQGLQIRTMQIYGDPGVTVTVIESSIENDTESTLASSIGPGSGAACLSSTGDGLKYVTVKLSFTNTTVEFDGGKLNIATA